MTTKSRFVYVVASETGAEGIFHSHVGAHREARRLMSPVSEPWQREPDYLGQPRTKIVKWLGQHDRFIEISRHKVQLTKDVMK